MAGSTLCFHERLYTRTGSWIVSWKQSLVERNGQKFGPSGYIKHTNAKHGQKAHTGIHRTQAGSWVSSRKESLIKQNSPIFGPSGLYRYPANAKYGKKPKQEVT